MPGGHAGQLWAPASAAKLPALQGAQLVEPVTEVKKPGEHSLQVAWLA